MNIYDPSFWAKVWRSAGIQSIAFFAIGYIILGEQPGIRATPAELVSFYHGDRTRILIASVFLGFGVLNLMWFGAALASALRDAGMGGWAGAATASTAAFGAIVLVNITISTGLAYSILGTGGLQLASALNDFCWALAVLTSFPAAMVLMSGTFGLWRAQIISNGTYWMIFPGWVLVVIGATTWASSGFWAPDGAYLQFITPIIFALLVTFFSGLLTLRVEPSEATERAAVMAG
jgi:hypothetical protein